MLSYRHAYHAGNHADVLKHIILIATMRYLTQKDTALHVIDTHAGAGSYRLDSEQASKSGEAQVGIFKLLETQEHCEPVADYLDVLASFNRNKVMSIYPGSPMIAHSLMRAQDKLHAFEIHPTDMPLLRANLRQADTMKQTTLHITDGFGATRSLLPPVSRRGLIVIDPSYEVKTDYPKTLQCVADGLERFATGTFMVWYPALPRIDSMELPKRLMRLAERTSRTWLHATLAVRGPNEEGAHGLGASGVVVINPPFTLHDQLKLALPEITAQLAQTRLAHHTLATS